MKKRFLILLTLAVVLLMSLQISVFAAEEHEWIGPVVDALLDPPAQSGQRATVSYWDSSIDCYGDALTGIAKEIYEGLESRFIAHEAGIEEIPVELVPFEDGAKYAWTFEGILTYSGSSFSANEAWIDEAMGVAYDALRAFVYDHPEYFWIREAYGVGRSLSSSRAALDLYYIAQNGFENQAEQKEALWETVDQLVAAVEGLTDAEKIAWWDNWLAVNNRYNGGALATGYISTDATPWSAIGAMLNGYQPVCEGYAKALQLLCHQAGIPCVQQSGVAKGGNHMWAAVKLDDQWYFCDPTWDDPNADEDSWDYSYRAYLLTTQPSSHASWIEPVLGQPRIASSAYTQPMSVSFGWSASGSTLAGYEIGSGTMIIALYDADGRFLTMGTCSSIRWDLYESIYLAPDFSKAVVSQAGSVVRFNLRDTVGWAPAAAAASIR